MPTLVVVPLESPRGCARRGPARPPPPVRLSHPPPPPPRAFGARRVALGGPAPRGGGGRPALLCRRPPPAAAVAQAGGTPGTPGCGTHARRGGAPNPSVAGVPVAQHTAVAAGVGWGGGARHAPCPRCQRRAVSGGGGAPRGGARAAGGPARGSRHSLGAAVAARPRRHASVAGRAIAALLRARRRVRRHFRRAGASRACGVGGGGGPR